MTAILPAQLLYIAAQFATTDECKGVITSINVRRKDDTITIVSTDGHRAFRCSFEINEHYHMDEEELNIHFNAFKKRVAKARYAIIKDTTVEFKDINGSMLSINPIDYVAGDYPTITSAIWPDTYNNEPAAPVAFNAKYLAEFLNEVARFGINGNVKMQMNMPTTPMQFDASIEAFGDVFEAFYLLMPVMILK